MQGKPVSLYTLRNERGMLVQITNYGARVVALWAPGADSVHRDVVWGYETIDDYLAAGDRFSGPIVGRYGNRIGGARFELDGREYRLTVNDGANHLHGGSSGFADKVWDARPFVNEAGEQAVEMSYLSPDGEEGYPGTLSISVTYTLTADNALRIDYRATTDAPTVLNPTSHVYFNLNGTSARGIGSHVLTIHAGRYTPTDGGLIPTGELASVEGYAARFSDRNADRVARRVRFSGDAVCRRLRSQLGARPHGRFARAGRRSVRAVYGDTDESLDRPARPAVLQRQFHGWQRRRQARRPA